MADTTPTNGDDIISKEFLQNALKQEAKARGDSSPIPEILSYTSTLGTKPGDNYMSIIYSVEVTFADSKIPPRHLFLKCSPNNPSRQEFTNRSNMFYKEWEIYSRWMPELRRLQSEVVGLDQDHLIRLPYPHYVHGECIDFQSEEGAARKEQGVHSLDNFIIMEDIRNAGFRMTDRRLPLDLDHMRLAVEALAKVHSLSWAYRCHVEPRITEKFPCFVANFAEDMEMWSQALDSYLEQGIRIYDADAGLGPGNACSAAAQGFRAHLKIIEDMFMGRSFGEGLEKLFRIPNADPKRFGKDAENPEPWRIICHGDCWSNNMLFRYDPETGKPLEIVLVDLQMAQETCVVNDLEYLVHVCTDLELRKAHIDELLQLYHDTFNATCKLLKTPTLPGFCMDSLRFRFHRGKLLGYYLATLTLPMMLTEEDQAAAADEVGGGGGGGEVGVVDDVIDKEEITKILAERAAAFESNLVYKRKLVDLTQGMIEDGVF